MVRRRCEECGHIFYGSETNPWECSNCGAIIEPQEGEEKV